MAERRMFAKTIIDSDAFLDMPLSSQLLYFHLSMRADDEGFVNKPKTIMRMVGAKDDDINVLIAKKFIIPFESGVVVIKHWRIHNYLQNDRITETKYKEERALLEFDDNKAYRKKNNNVYSLPEECIHDSDKPFPQYRLEENRLDKIIKPTVILDGWFNEFWSIYPKKVQRKTSEQKFKLYVKDECTFNAILLDVRMRLKSTDWTKENGRFIPHPTTYLNQQRWEDETKPEEKATSFMDMLREEENGKI